MFCPFHICFSQPGSQWRTHLLLLLLLSAPPKTVRLSLQLSSLKADRKSFCCICGDGTWTFCTLYSLLCRRGSVIWGTESVLGPGTNPRHGQSVPVKTWLPHQGHRETTCLAVNKKNNGQIGFKTHRKWLTKYLTLTQKSMEKKKLQGLCCLLWSVCYTDRNQNKIYHKRKKN